MVPLVSPAPDLKRYHGPTWPPRHPVSPSCGIEYGNRFIRSSSLLPSENHLSDLCRNSLCVQEPAPIRFVDLSILKTLLQVVTYYSRLAEACGLDLLLTRSIGSDGADMLARRQLLRLHDVLASWSSHDQNIGGSHRLLWTGLDHRKAVELSDCCHKAVSCFLVDVCRIDSLDAKAFVKGLLTG
jgi:hypothetical protein